MLERASTDVARSKIASLHAKDTILLVGGSPHPCSPELLVSLAHTHGLIIACDSALNICKEAGVVPDIAVGDFDSVDVEALEWARACSATFVTSHWHKDETDLGMALRLIHEARYGSASSASAISEEGLSSRYWIDTEDAAEGVEVTLTSCLGGRLDHQLAIVGKMLEFAHMRPRIVADQMSATLMHACYRSQVTTGLSDQYKTASALALTTRTKLSLRGFEWDLDKQEFTLLDMGKLAGTSNIIKEPAAEVRVHSGALIFIVNHLMEMDKLADVLGDKFAS